MSTDAIVLLKADHKEIREQFRRFAAAGENAAAAKGKIVDKIIELLTVHTFIENEVMYPEVRTLLPDLEDDVLESYEEHHVADVLVAELAAMAPDAERSTPRPTCSSKTSPTTWTRKKTTGSPRSARALAANSCRTWARRCSS